LQPALVKINKTLPKRWHMAIILAIQEAEVGGSRYKVGLNRSTRPCLKKETESRRTGSMSQEVEGLPSKHEA
jgi:hypothetical protein